MAASQGFPLIYQHEDACGVRGTERVRASTLPVVSILLTARGADRVLVPTPHELEGRRAESGVAELPEARRRLVQFVDQRASTIERIRAYLEPLRSQARKWPESTFVCFAETFLYESALASEHGAGVLSSSPSVLRDFVPLVDPNVFSGEAQFRLAEIARLVCSYVPCAIEHGSIIAENPTEATARCREIMELAEFRSLVAESGRLGYLRDPVVGFRRVRNRLRQLLSKPSVKPILAAATTAADAAGVGQILSGARTAADVISVPAKSRDFRPPFLSMGPASLGVYRSALSRIEGASPSPGMIMAFETTCLGHTHYSWLNEGEEAKLEQEAQQGIGPRLKKHREAHAALARFGAVP